MSNLLEPLVEDVNVTIDNLERSMIADMMPIECPLFHRFTDSAYCRTIFMPKGSVVTSKIHRTQHFYVVLKGKAAVFIPEKGVEVIEAPFIGVTEPGTRRVLLMLEDTLWATFHPTEEGEFENLAAIEERIIEKRELNDGKSAFELYRAALEQFRQIESDAAPLLGDGGKEFL